MEFYMSGKENYEPLLIKLDTTVLPDSTLIAHTFIVRLKTCLKCIAFDSVNNMLMNV